MKFSQDGKNGISNFQTDSLMDLLVAQCSDLEGLLALARRETVAAQSENFSELFRVFEDRASVGERLETYHRQLAELRQTLGHAVDADATLATRTTELAVAIQTQDNETTALLRRSHLKIGEEITRLDNGQRNSIAYLQGPRPSGLNCDRRG